jgi:hypothetical protein
VPGCLEMLLMRNENEQMTIVVSSVNIGAISAVVY